MILGNIYCITNTVNNKAYVGKTLLSIQKRFQQHLQDAKRFTDRPLYRAINKYGAENFSITLLEEVEQSQLSSREQYWIAQKIVMKMVITPPVAETALFYMTTKKS